MVVQAPKALFLLGGEVSPHPSRSVGFVLGWPAKWRKPNCALPREGSGACGVKTAPRNALLGFATWR